MGVQRAAPLQLPPPPDIVLSLGTEGGTQQIANNTAVDCEAFIEQERKSINVHLLFHTYSLVPKERHVRKEGNGSTLWLSNGPKESHDSTLEKNIVPKESHDCSFSLT